jgi:hypothetical protein
MNASNLNIGATVILNSGAYYPSRRATVMRHEETPWGINTWVRAEAIDGSEVYSESEDTTIEGSETLLGIGWRRA